ncbi:iron complex transport system permease protein [Actinoplanes lutulentus]|uniref:Iron complex transport system permease protein n=1 Tax=Actinoplanes lutulentus TaxID=1287878 RepID=A0A327ZJ34_9ACTN|nr:iron chelate uptake ABC transporter family permease subunit [Actinoplanes lutulentus]MBB2943925.1 iron complex transport system permease protein [Actinoplanes lutulentus]RAK42842.1 iron complex transport system permease protein [Actinoplanes lutulentus]
MTTLTLEKTVGSRVGVRPRAVVVGVVAALLAAAIAVLTLGTGEFPIPPADVVKTLFGQGTAAQDFIVNELRLPRVITAILVGMALAAGGAVFQSLVRNPLGSPDVLGITNGASTAALTVVILGGSSTQLSLAAVAGGLGAAVLIQLVGGKHGLHGYRFILVGIGMSAIFTGISGYLLTRGVQMENARALLWLTGSLDGRDWQQAGPLLGVLVLTLPILLLACGPGLRILEMGDDSAAALGVPVKALRTTALFTATLLVACAAAAAGPVAFVALIAPHLAKKITRAPGPNLVPALAMGALLLVGADWIAQHTPRVLPVGVVTGAIGGAYLVWLLTMERRAGRI